MKVIVFIDEDTLIKKLLKILGCGIGESTVRPVSCSILIRMATVT